MVEADARKLGKGNRQQSEIDARNAITKSQGAHRRAKQYA
jgi:hypothetical protein